MKKTPNPKRLRKYKFYIPAKLQSSLFEDVTSLWWKDVIESIENKDFNSILKILKKIDKTKGVLYLPHPFKEDTSTFPVKNIRRGMCNYIFSVIQVEIINGYCVS